MSGIFVPFSEAISRKSDVNIYIIFSLERLSKPKAKFSAEFPWPLPSVAHAISSIAIVMPSRKCYGPVLWTETILSVFCL